MEIEIATIDQILDLLAIVATPNRKWRFTSNGAIRDVGGRCPICAIVHELNPLIRWTGMAHQAFRDIGVQNHNAINDIMDAADNCAPDPSRDFIRDRMILTLGLVK